MSLPIPREALEQHIIALGKTGAGKSSAVRDLVEYLLDHKQRVVIITPKADWWGLKLDVNGKKAGYPIVVFGSDHSDLPLHPRSGVALAELLATGNRSAVLQMRDFMPGERTQFWIDFASTLYRKISGKLYLVIDEVHNFAPKGKVHDNKAGMMLHWSNKLASESRGLGITLICASQRASKVHNDLLTSCETLIAMRVTTSWDRDAVAEWIEGCGDEAQGKEVIRTLASMKRGDAWAWSPEIDFGPKQIHFPMFKTFDSFQPQVSRRAKNLKGWADVNLTEVKAKLESFVKEVEDNDPEKLRAKVRNLTIALSQERSKAKVAAVAPTVKPVADKPLARSAVTRIVRDILMRERGQYAKALVKIQTEMHNRLHVYRNLKTVLDDVLSMPIPEAPKLPDAKQVADTITSFAPKLLNPPVKPKPLFVTPRTRNSEPPAGSENGKGPLKAGARRLLAALAQWSPQGMTEGQMRAQAGLRKSGTYSNYLSSLRTGGLLIEKDGLLYATEQGVEVAGTTRQPTPTTTEEVLAIWRPKLKKGARALLDILVRHNGEEVTRGQLADESGLSGSSGTFSNYISSLATARLIKRLGDGYAADRESLLIQVND